MKRRWLSVGLATLLGGASPVLGLRLLVAAAPMLSLCGWESALSKNDLAVIKGEINGIKADVTVNVNAGGEGDKDDRSKAGSGRPATAYEGTMPATCRPNPDDAQGYVCDRGE